MNIDARTRSGIVVGVGMVGGAAIGGWAYEHMFVEGLSAEERKGLLLFSASVVLAYGVAQVLKLDRRLWDLQATANWAKAEIESAAR